MSKKSYVTCFIIVMFSAAFLHRAGAVGSGLSLPSTLVRIEVVDGTESYFLTTLSDVPSGYDVGNQTYPGWCIDETANMSKSPELHEVTLYSSNTPPGTLASERWDMVNYVLNHMNGTRMDIQQALWYFINMVGNYTPSRAVAWDMVNDALANGSGFVPGSGQIIAVICLPKALLPQPTGVQISIIEFRMTIPEFPSSLIQVLFAVTALSVVGVYGSRRLRGRKRIS